MDVMRGRKRELAESGDTRGHVKRVLRWIQVKNTATNDTLKYVTANDRQPMEQVQSTTLIPLHGAELDISGGCKT